jgi:DNA-binding response OmpR family regulator/chromosome segregation ATPase
MSESTQSAVLDAAAPNGAGTKPTKRPRILIVESDGFTRTVLLLLFRTIGFGVDITSNGMIGLHKFRSNPPDALLVEIKLTGMSGLELIQAARSDPRFKGRPIYVFTDPTLMKRSTRKKVLMSVTKLFDKSAISMEKLVENVKADLTEGEPGEGHAPKAEEMKDTEQPEATQLHEEIADIISGVSAQWDLVLKCKGPDERLQRCREFLSRVCSLGSCAKAAGQPNLARQAKALEQLLTQASKEQNRSAEAALGTVSRAVQLLGSVPSGNYLKEFSAVIIDEWQPSGESIGDAFREAGFKPTVFDEPARALVHLASNRADLIVVNVKVPELHGLELPKIRKLATHAATPVIFVPQLPALDHAEEAWLTTAPTANNNPLLLMELVMKALNEVLSEGVSSSTPPHATPPPTPPTPKPVQVSAVSKQPSPSPVTHSTLDPDVPIFTRRTDLPRPTPRPEQNIQQPLASFIPQPTTRISAKPVPSSEGTKTILFVEDDPFALKLYTKGLKRAGFEVQVAENGLLALDALSQNKPDLVVLDLMLPEMPGLEVLRFIRSEGHLKDTPVIVLSNAYLDELATEAINAGANRGLLKTECTPAKLVEQVCELLSQPVETAGFGAIQEDAEPITLPGNVDLVAETAIWTRQAGLRKEAPKEVAKIRQVCLNYIKTADEDKSLPQLMDLYRRVRFLTAHAALIGFTKIAEVSSAFEGLLFEIVCKQSEPTVSTFQILAQAVDVLDKLVQQNDTTFAEPRTNPRVLVVDEDAACNEALASALRRGKFDVQCAQDPFESLRMLNKDNFDLILLEIDMPRLNGFEVCEQLRRMPQHQSVPVLFVTVNAEIQDRARGVISGGDDLISKPVAPLELVLKATMHLLMRDGQGLSAQPDEQSIEGQEEGLEALSNAAEPILSEADSPAIMDISAPAPSTEPDSVAFVDPAESLSFEASQTAEAGEALADNGIDPGLSLSAGAVAEEPTLEHEFEIHKPVSDSESSNVGPATEARNVEAEWLAGAATDAANSAAPTPSESETGADPYRIVPGAEAVPSDFVADGQIEATPMSAGAAEAPASARNVQGDWAPGAARQPAKPAFPARNAAASAPNEYASVPASQSTAAMPAPAQENVDASFQNLQSECAKLREALAKHETDREILVNRVVTSENDLHRAQARLERREETIKNLQAQLEPLKAQLAASPEASQRLKELENDLSQRAAELERAKGDLEKQSVEHQRTESELRQQLEATATATKQSEAAQSQAQSRTAQLEQELAAQRQIGEELNSKFAREQQASAESGNRVKELQNDLSQRALDLERAKGELEKHAAEHQRAESELRQQLEAAAAAGKQSEAVHLQAQSRTAQLEQELAAQRQVSEELNSKFAKERQASAESGNRAQELQNELSRRATELEYTKGELKTLAAERARAESDLQKQLDAVGTAGKQSQAAHAQAQSRIAQLEQELASTRQAGEELNSKFAKERQVSADTGNRVQELEKQLSQRASELEHNKSQHEQQVAEHGRVESDLRKQLQAAELASKQNGAAHTKAQSRIAQLEQELTALRQFDEDLNCKFAREQQVSAQSGSRVQELEKQLTQRAADLETTKAQVEKQAAEHGRVEAKLRKQLEAAEVAGKQNEAAQSKTQSRVGQLEQELAAVRQASEELNSRFAKEQQASAKSGSRAQELEKQLTQRAGELQESKAQLEKQTAEHGRVESKLRQQLEAAEVAGKQSEATHSQVQSRVAQLEQELAATRQASEELNSRLTKEQQSRAESASRVQELEKNLNQRAEELEQGKAHLEEQATEHGRVESKLRKQLEAIGAAGKQMEAAHQQAQSRVADLERELGTVRKASEELNSRLAKEQQTRAESSNKVQELEKQLRHRASDLEQARSKWDKQSAEQRRTESKLRKQLEVSDAAGKQNQAAHEKAQSRIAELEAEAVSLRKLGEDLNCKVAREQQVSAESSNRVQELEKQLSRHAAELEGARGEMVNQAAEHGRVVSDLRGQLEAAHAASKQNEQAHARLAELEKNIAELQQLNGELTANLGKEQADVTRFHALNRDLEAKLQAALAAPHPQATEYEERISQSVAALARVTADLASERGERQRSDERAAALNLRLQGLHAESARLLQSQRADQERIANLETQLRQLDDTAGRRALDLDQQKAECLLAEEQLQTAKEQNAQLRKRLSAFERAHHTMNSTQGDLHSRLQSALDAAQQSESMLQRESAESQRLATALDGTQRELQSQSQRRETLETELQRALQALREGESKLHHEASERQRLNEALSTAQLNLRDQSQRSDLELTKLQAALQFEQLERERQEAQMARMRQSSLDSARCARLLRKTLRRQTREPVDSLYQAVCGLLQLELRPDQKKLAETMLHDVLMVQHSLQEPEIPQADSNEAAQKSNDGAKAAETSPSDKAEKRT